MAAVRQPVGSAKWISQERDQARKYIEQELEDFRISTLNDMESFNEAMADIFAKQKQNFAEMFKTPSKLRGKTPRTTRKTDPRSARAPLTEFAPNNNSTAPALPLPQSASQVCCPEYHSDLKLVSPSESLPPIDWNMAKRATNSESTFVSAKEHDSPPFVETAAPPEPETEPVIEKEDVDMEDAPGGVPVYQSNDEDKENKENNVEMEELEAHSEASSPAQEQPLHRKSSFTFSSLPAREPLHQKFKSTSILPNMVVATETATSQTTTESSQSQPKSQSKSPKSQATTAVTSFTTDTDNNTVLHVAQAPLHKSISTPVLSRVAAGIENRTPVRPMHQKANSTTVVPSPSALDKAETETISSPKKGGFLSSALKSARKVWTLAGSTSAAAKNEARSNDEELANAPETTEAPAPSMGKLKAPARLARPTKEAPQSKPVPAIIRVASQSQRLGHQASQPSFSKSTTERSAPPSRDGTSRAPPPMGGRVKALEAAAKKKEADERAVAKKAEAKLEIERKRTEAKAQKEADERKKAEAKLQRAAEERKRVEAEERRREFVKAHREAEERKRAEAKAQKEAEAKAQKEAEKAQKEAEEARSRAAHDLAESIKRERAAQNPPHPRSDVPGTLRQLTKTLKPALKRPMESAQNAPAADAKRRKTDEEPDEQMGGMGQSRPSVMAPPKRPSMMRKEPISKFNHSYSHAPPPAAHHASNMYKSGSSAQMQHLQHKPQHPSHLVQMSSARIPFAGGEPSTERHYVPAQAQPARNPFAASESSHQQQQQYHASQNPQMYKTPARPVSHALPKSSVQPKSANTLLGDNISLPDILTDSEDEDDDDPNAFRVPSWAATPALKDKLVAQQLIDPETIFGPIGEMNMEEMFKNGKNSERLKQFRQRGSSALWIENRDQITSAEKTRDREARERIARDGGWRYQPGAFPTGN